MVKANYEGDSRPAGVLFLGGNEAATESAKRGVFGMHRGGLGLVSCVAPDTPCFMYNYDTQVLPKPSAGVPVRVKCYASVLYL
jgi:hypothetical protein